jgi:hypothetical protein
MKRKIRILENIEEILDHLSSMLVSAPKFLDRTGYFPFQNIDTEFQQLSVGLDFNRLSLGDARYQDLKRMSDEMRSLFEADRDDKTGDTADGCKIILAMEDILRDARRASCSGI